MRRLILVLATIGVAVLLASGAALGITGGFPDGVQVEGNLTPDDATDDVYSCLDPNPTNGNYVCKYPQVGAMVDPHGFNVGGQTLYTYCTGTLISPTVFLTAAHCSPGRDDGVTFDVQYVPGKSKLFEIKCSGKRCNQDDYHAQWYADPLIDIAVVVLKAPDDANDPPLPNVTPAQLPSLNRLNDVERDQMFTAVGYGDQVTSFKDSNDHLDVRMYAYSAYKSVNRTYLSLSQNQNQEFGGTCSGDSGGPNFFGKEIHQPLTIAGTTITGDTWCKATNVTLRLDTAPVQKFLSQFKDDGVTLSPGPPAGLRVPEEDLVP